MSKNIRTRFAPSPTGQLHIGNARTAILNWIFARHAGGQFLLRIEDTDRERSTEASEKSILQDLAWLGLDWDEGPDKGGDSGPYRQSQRLGLYSEHLDRLIQNGQVYPCYCTAEELETRRQERLAKGEATQYDGRCRNLNASEARKFQADGREPAFRFRAEPEGVSFDDLVRGTIAVPGEQLGDFIVARADRMPMYNFACVVDDHRMQISHIIRGDDHVSNTPRQILIYRAFGWPLPAFAHIPMILGGDRQRLSKRHGATSVEEYRKQGYLPEALINFLSLLSWSSASGEEILSVPQLIREFDFTRISKSAAMFDAEKLNWMNGIYIRNLDPDAFAERLLPHVRQAGYPVPDAAALKPMAVLFQEKLETLSGIGPKIGFFFAETCEPETAEAAGVIRTESSQKALRVFLKETAAMASIDRAGFQALMKAVQTASGVKGKDLWMPVRIALTGQEHGPDLAGAAEILGIEKCRKRIESAIAD